MTEEPRDESGRPLGMYDYRDLSPTEKRRHDAYYGKHAPTLDERVGRLERQVEALIRGDTESAAWEKHS